MGKGSTSKFEIHSAKNSLSFLTKYSFVENGESPKSCNFTSRSIGRADTCRSLLCNGSRLLWVQEVGKNFLKNVHCINTFRIMFAYCEQYTYLEGECTC